MDNSQDQMSILKFDQQGGGAHLSSSASSPTTGLEWVHLPFFSAETNKWLVQQPNLDELIVEALLAKETRPRTIVMKNGLLLTLRTINQDPQSDPEDMISIRIWIEEHRIITIAKTLPSPLLQMKNLLETHQGAKSLDEFIDELIERITNQISDQVEKIDFQIDKLEDDVLGRTNYSLRPKLAEQRKQIIALKRFMAPQRDALSKLSQIDQFPWLSEKYRSHFRESSDRTIRCLEDLDEAKERATIIQETLSSKSSAQVEHRIYILSMIAAIFLPLGLITSLLGINVAGIPAANSPFAFLIVCMLLILVGFFEYWLFKKKRWL